MSKEKKKRAAFKQESFLKYSVGNDISKDKFDSCISVIDSLQRVKIIATGSFNNTPKGFECYLTWVNRKCKFKLPIVHIMEATGIYYEKLAWFLHQSEERLCVVLPNKSKKYMQSIGLKTKTDRIDAKGLSRMGAEQNLAQWEAPDEHLMGLRAVTRQRESLQSTKTQLNNQLKSMEAGQFVNDELTKQQKAIIALIDKQILETEAMIKNIIANNAEMEEKVNKITEIKGLGVISVATVIAETFGFKYFTSQRQLVSYSGYDVIENQSGKRIGKTKISKKGNSHIRRILHMPSFSVVTNNEPIFSSLYERVYASSKLKMKAYVAVQRKLLTIIYTLWKKNERYDNQYHNKNLPVMQS